MPLHGLSEVLHCCVKVDLQPMSQEILNELEVALDLAEMRRRGVAESDGSGVDRSSASTTPLVPTSMLLSFAYRKLLDRYTGSPLVTSPHPDTLCSVTDVLRQPLSVEP